MAEVCRSRSPRDVQVCARASGRPARSGSARPSRSAARTAPGPGGPRPVLHDLGRRLDEVRLGSRAGEPRTRPGSALWRMWPHSWKSVLTSSVAQQRRAGRPRRREVRDDRADGAASRRRPHDADDQRERRRVPELALAREQIHYKCARVAARASRISNSRTSGAMPSRREHAGTRARTHRRSARTCPRWPAPAGRTRRPRPGRCLLVRLLTSS